VKARRFSLFKRDYKREPKGRYRAVLDNVLKPVLLALATDQALELCFRDQELSGNWADWRECHLRPNLLLIRTQTPCGWLGLAHTLSFLVKVLVSTNEGHMCATKPCPSWQVFCFWFCFYFSISPAATEEPRQKKQRLYM